MELNRLTYFCTYNYSTLLCFNVFLYFIFCKLCLSCIVKHVYSICQPKEGNYANECINVIIINSITCVTSQLLFKVIIRCLTLVKLIVCTVLYTFKTDIVTSYNVIKSPY